MHERREMEGKVFKQMAGDVYVEHANERGSRNRLLHIELQQEHVSFTMCSTWDLISCAGVSVESEIQWSSRGRKHDMKVSSGSVFSTALCHSHAVTCENDHVYTLFLMDAVNRNRIYVEV